jgi:cytochrome b561
MQLTDTSTSYGWLSIALHWLVAGLTVFLFINGEDFAGAPRGPIASALRVIHIDWGMVATAIVLARIVWRWRQGSPAKSEQWALLNLLAAIVQWGLIAALVVTCITGVVVVWSGGQAINIFGVLSLPSPMARSGALHGLMESVHSIAAHVMIPLVILHVLGALKHALIDRDNVFWRMLRPARQA